MKKLKATLIHLIKSTLNQTKTMKLPIDSTPTFYNSKEGCINNICLCDSFKDLKDETKIAYVEETKKEYEEKYPELELMSFSKALELSQKADKERYQAGVCKEITEANFHEMLNCLYPANWVNYSTNESFRLSEDLTGELSNFYIRVFDGDFPNHKERFFSVVMPRDTRHNRLIDIASKQFNLEVK